MPIISLVVPVFNEEKGIDIFYKAACEALSKQKESFELIFINDGSTDRSLEELLDINRHDPRVKIIDFTRNFGQQYALTAGIDFSAGSAVILMDVDMEDPPDRICDFLEYWKRGYDVVYAIRKKRKVGITKRTLFFIHHKINTIISDISMPDSSGIFGLMDRKVVNMLKSIPEKNRYLPGLRAWVGLKQLGLEVERGKRYDKNSRVSILQLIKLAFDSYISFSKIPLKIASFLGIFFSLVSFVGIFVIILLKLTGGIQPHGWASIVMVILFVTGIQLITIGIIGEYVGRILDEAKNRPLYLVKQVIGFEKMVE